MYLHPPPHTEILGAKRPAQQPRAKHPGGEKARGGDGFGAKRPVTRKELQWLV